MHNISLFLKPFVTTSWLSCAALLFSKLAKHLKKILKKKEKKGIHVSPEVVLNHVLRGGKKLLVLCFDVSNPNVILLAN